MNLASERLVCAARCCAVALIVLAAGGCGDLTAGGATGEATVVVSGDAPDGGPAPSFAVAGVPPTGAHTGPASAGSATDAPLLAEGEDHPEGQLEATFRIYLVQEGGGLLPLADDDIDVSLDLEGVEEPEVARRVVSAGRYVGLRLVFKKIEVEVDAGLIIDGQPVTGPIDVDFDEVELEVARTLDLRVPDDGTVVVLVDLNAGSWLQVVDPITSSVDARVIAELVDVTLR